MQISHTTYVQSLFLGLPVSVRYCREIQVFAGLLVAPFSMLFTDPSMYIL